MGYFLLFGGLTVVFFLVAWYVNEHTHRDWEAFGVAGFIFAVIFIVGAITIPVNHWSINGEIAEFNSTQVTLDVARGDGADLEDAALQIKAVECNQWLAKHKYLNSIWLAPWIPNEIDDLNPIK